MKFHVREVCVCVLLVRSRVPAFEYDVGDGSRVYVGGDEG